MGWLPSWQVILFTLEGILLVLEGIPTIIEGKPPLDLAQDILVSECDTVLPTRYTWTGSQIGEFPLYRQKTDSVNGSNSFLWRYR